MTQLRQMKENANRKVHLVQVIWYDALDPDAEIHVGPIYEPTIANLATIKQWVLNRTPVNGVPDHYTLGIRPLNRYGQRLKVRHGSAPAPQVLTPKQLAKIKSLGIARKRKATQRKRKPAGKRGAK